MCATFVFDGIMSVKASSPSAAGPIPGSSGPALGTEEAVELMPIIVKAFKMAGIGVGVWAWGYLGFSVAWIFVALFFHVASEECRKYKESKKAYALQAVLNEREAILSRVDDHSSWVFFPDIEKAEWFNKVVRQMWPYIGEYVKEVLKDSVEPSIQNNLPSNLKSFKFESIDMGDIPPRVDGVKVYTDSKKKDEIICDIDLRYNGDANIKVAVKGVTAGIKSLSVNGTMRVIMKPLISETPIIGGLSVFFLNRPIVDFNLTAAANVLDAPLLNKSLRTIVEEQLSYYLVLPHRIPIPLANNVDFALLKYPLPQGAMRLEVVEAKDLKRADTKVFGKGGKSDPYCKIVVGAREMKTKVLSNTVNPMWKQCFQFVVDQKHGQCIDIQVFDHDVASNNDDSLGTASIDIELLARNGFIDLWYPLEDVKTGQIYLRAMWMSLTPDINLLNQAKVNAKETGFGADDGWSYALLMVTVDQATNLPLGLKSGKMRNSFVQLTVGESKERSAVKMNQKNPKWDENFQLLVRDPESDNLILEIFHRGKSDKRLSQVAQAVNEVLTSDNMTLKKTFRLIECGANSTITVKFALLLLTSEIRPRWSGGLGGVKLGRIASVTKEPATILHASHSSSGGGGSGGGGGGGKTAKREPSITMPVMALPKHRSDSSQEASTARSKSSKESTPVRETYSTGNASQSDEMEPSEFLRAGTAPAEGNILKDSTETSEPESHVGQKPLHESTPVRMEPVARSVTPVSQGSNSSRFGQVQLTIRYSSQRGQLVVVVHHCRNLIPCDKDNLADPYIRIYLLPDRSNKKKTKMVKNSLNPVFDETFEWPMAQMEAPFRTLDIAVKNDVGLFSKSRTDMGRLMLELAQLGDLTKATTEWYNLEEVKSS